MPTVLRVLEFWGSVFTSIQMKGQSRPIFMSKQAMVSAVDIRKVERLVYEHQAFLLEKYDDFQSQ